MPIINNSGFLPIGSKRYLNSNYITKIERAKDNSAISPSFLRPVDENLDDRIYDLSVGDSLISVGSYDVPRYEIRSYTPSKVLNQMLTDVRDNQKYRSGMLEYDKDCFIPTDRIFSVSTGEHDNASKIIMDGIGAAYCDDGQRSIVINRKVEDVVKAISKAKSTGKIIDIRA